jgi:hypothetical protein
MTDHQPNCASQRDLLRAKIAAGAAAKAAADSALFDLQRAANAVISTYFLNSTAACRLTRRLSAVEDLRTSAGKAASLWLFGAAERPAIIGFDARLVVAAADIAIARALSGAQAAAPTVIDRAVAAAFARRLAAVVAPLSDDIARRPPRSGAIDDLLSKDAPARWTLYSIDIDLGAGGEAMTAIAAFPADHRSEISAPAGVEGLRRRFKALPVSARCIAGGLEAPLARLLDLKPGDILTIAWRGGSAPLMVGNREFAIGALGEHEGRRAIKLARPLLPHASTF